jgi:hypothetical protein
VQLVALVIASADAAHDLIVVAFLPPSQLLLFGALRRPLEFTQYTSLAFGRRCELLGVRPSMGSVGDAYDNAMAESFFATLECELIDRYRFHTRSEATMAVFGYIEGWYNPRRRHSALGYESPLSFERKQGPRAAEALESSLVRLSASRAALSQKTTRQDALGSTRATSSDPRYPLLRDRARPSRRRPAAKYWRLHSTPLRLRRSGSS